jgi:RNA polymerase sigma factor (sigma-70 family)
VRYRSYGLPISDVISEGNVGLIRAVERFEPDKGFRLTTYAMWWIKASIQDYILRSWAAWEKGLIRGFSAALPKICHSARTLKSCLVRAEWTGTIFFHPGINRRLTESGQCACEGNHKDETHERYQHGRPD